MHAIQPNSHNWKNNSDKTLKLFPKYDNDDFVTNRNLQIITSDVGKKNIVGIR